MLSLVFEPDVELDRIESDLIEANVKCSFYSGDTAMPVEWQLELSMAHEDLAEIREDHQEQVAFSLRQSSDVLPYPWTNLAILPDEKSRFLWDLHPLLQIPADSTGGRITIGLESKNDDTLKTGFWYVRIQRFLDAV